MMKDVRDKIDWTTEASPFPKDRLFILAEKVKSSIRSA